MKKAQYLIPLFVYLNLCKTFKNVYRYVIRETMKILKKMKSKYS